MNNFLNTLFDNLEEFLSFDCEIEAAEPPARCEIGTDSAASLARCVFPSLFGYFWAFEAAETYAECLSLKKKTPDFVDSFDRHWLFEAMKAVFR
jgi:hypothetical protein